ncbi:MAG: RnfABCDGE type electron transport complex subunit A [Pseudodesulfovibrio sp.]|uniref:Ion-translocating oxidoreductase complex subunit A n=1 Tax=Pseudodesulfovibrio aespoeensis (strain ATCC 700646 / DSM 10631 / Aspo-2) TaxID=643562 RepID=E6VVA5_PSEA9|nr:MULTISPECIES: RnfABCDGE type electron transport complex subunit A [Pseudodesulfovibrio]MBU4193210.1 RnfABCDGE type electron transport complex subunit A [Pseudomonadota bacterium]ADU62349.1 electron transport complex, RnfABCDGE type, A subunit [Pseudodesulfovibrio aespoeensis Aspo-2]MBU4243144.1 RnfABCDGE type electron transport complex subunit A [Pseudomonadota bacterium]MBU4377683.1 RnfABCDGE type electron transport complex subunit A [Pseudomonadota bacterium]MBU4473987.1 RnfABCDGE type el
MDYFVLIIAAIFVNNIVLAQYLGNCPFIGTSKESGVAMGMGLAVVFVATMAAAITWCVQRFLLMPNDLAYLQTITFILVIAALVQFVEMFLKKVVPPLYKSLGIFLPLITTNCAVLGIAIICQREEFTLVETILFSIASGVGFMLALVVLASIRERLDLARVPVSLRGTPLALIMAGLMSLAFFAFKGMAS